VSEAGESVDLMGRARRARALLGTLVEIEACGPAQVLAPALDAALAAVARVHRLMSFHEPASDVARINAAAAGVAVGIDPDTWGLLRRAVEIGELSGGVFEIAIAGVLVADGLLPRSPAGAPPLDDHASFRDLDLDEPNDVTWRRKGSIDLGGIAKGFAVDQAVGALRVHGAVSGVVNAGGDLRCFGTPRPIQIRHPFAPGVRLELGLLHDCALATSAPAIGAPVGSDPVGTRYQRRCGRMRCRGCVHEDRATRLAARQRAACDVRSRGDPGAAGCGCPGRSPPPRDRGGKITLKGEPDLTG
jgi:thiamine biosynthesis lipoprotein ApbE